MKAIHRVAILRQFLGFDRRVYILGIGWLVTSAGFAMVIPFLSIYFHQELGISMGAIGIFFGYTAILRAIPQPLAGALSDSVGRVPLMAWSQIMRALTFGAVAWAIFSEKGFWAIAGIISFNYIFGAVLHPAANAMIADLTLQNKRLQAYAFLRIAGNLGWAIGPALGGFVAHQSYGWLFLLAGLMSLLSGLYFKVALKDVKAGPTGARSLPSLAALIVLREDRFLFRHCLISFVLFLVVAQLVAALSVYSVDTVGITQSQLGLLYGINGLMVVFFQFSTSHVLRRFRLTRQLAIGAFIYALGYFLVGLAGSFIHLIACMVVITLAEMIVSPPSVTLVANMSPPEKYGLYMGVFGLFHMSGWSFGPTVGGILLDLFAARPVYMWGNIALLALIAGLLYLWFDRRMPLSINRNVDDS